LSQEKLQEIRSLDDTPGNPALDVSAITAGRNLFATLHQDNTDRDTISTWDPRTQRLLTRGFPETDYEQIGVAPEGPTLATIERRGAVRVWDGATAQLQRTLRNPDGASPSRLAFSPDSGFLAISYDNGLVRIWNLRDGQVRRSIASGSQGQPVLAWSPDGTRVAVGGFDGRVRLFDTATGRQAGSFLTSKAIVQDIAFRPDGRWLLVGGLTNLTFWDVDNRRLLGSTPVSDVSQVAFSPVGDDVAASGEGRLTLWRDLWSPGDLCSAIAPFVTSDMIKPYLPPGWHSMCRYRTATGRTGP
jgi:WD40 repeat protein